MSLFTAIRQILKASRRFAGNLLRRVGLLPERSSVPFHVAIVLEVDNSTRKFMRRQQTQLMRRYGTNPILEAEPHITLKLGFPSFNLDDLSLLLEDVANQTEPFEIALKGYGSFPEEECIFLDVQPNGTLETLRTKIRDRLEAEHGVKPQPIEVDGYRFHATLAYELPRGEYRALLQDGAADDADFRFTVMEISLFVALGEHWFTYSRCPLGVGSSGISRT